MGNDNLGMRGCRGNEMRIIGYPLRCLVGSWRFQHPRFSEPSNFEYIPTNDINDYDGLVLLNLQPLLMA